MSFESKYVAASHIAPQMLRRLEASCRADGEHPTNRVHSVYFDTPQLEAIAEVDNGDYHKLKIRLRWYTDAGGAATTGYLECKRKRGPQRAKGRVAVPDFDSELPLHDGRWLRLPPRLATAGHPIPRGQLQPTLHISYRRHRFVEPLTGMRLALDSNIRVVRANRRFSALAAIAAVPAPFMVFEAKGDQRRLPPTLAFVRAFGARRQSFSKYGLWSDLCP